MNLVISGRPAIIWGANKWLGRGCARGLANEAVKIAINALTLSGLNQTQRK